MRTVLLAFFAALIAFSSSPSALASGPQDGTENPSVTPEEAANAAAEAYEESFSAPLAGLLEGRVDSFSTSVKTPTKPAEGFEEQIDRAMGAINGVIAGVFFYDVMGKSAAVDATSVLDDPSALEGLIAELEAKGNDFYTWVYNYESSCQHVTFPKARVDKPQDGAGYPSTDADLRQPTPGP